MSIYDYDNDFAHYEANEATKRKLGQCWTPYSIIEQLLDMHGLITDENSVWKDENKTDLDPTMGAGNIVIATLYRRIVECGQNPITALSNVYGVELDKKTLEYAQILIEKFMMKIEDNLHYKFTNEEWNNIRKIIMHNFVCSDFFEWNFKEWRPYTETEKEAIKLKNKREQEEKNAKVDSDLSFFTN